jgi:hypothetical protein
MTTCSGCPQLDQRFEEDEPGFGWRWLCRRMNHDGGPSKRPPPNPIPECGGPFAPGVYAPRKVAEVAK